MSTGVQPAPPRRRADHVRNGIRLLDAARVAFAEEGLEVSVAEIARRAGLAKGTFFKHFASKDELIHALAIARFQRVTAIAHEINTGREPGWETLRSIIEDMHEEVAHDRSFPEALRHPSQEAPDTEAALQALLDELDHALLAAQAKGEVRPDVIFSDLGTIMIGIIDTTAPFHADHPQLGRRYLRLVLDGLRPHDPSDLGAPPLPPDQRSVVRPSAHAATPVRRPTDWADA
jgi:AcrR family transcriptional regulator